MRPATCGRCRATRSNEAYRLYLYGSSLMARRTLADTRRAIDAYAQALRLDPLFSGAWARLGIARGNQYTWNWPSDVPRDSLSTLASATARRALDLDSASADAWLASGQAHFVSRDLGGARLGLKRGLRLDALDAELAYQYGALYGCDGWGLAIPEMAEQWYRHALALDPALRNAWRHLALCAEISGRLAEAEARWDTANAHGPWGPALRLRAAPRLRRGDGRGALADLAAAEPLESVPTMERLRALHLIATGDSAPALLELSHLRAPADGGEADFASVAQFAIALGLRVEALDALEQLRATADPRETQCAAATPCSASLRTWWVPHDPLFAPLRSDPRFQRLWEETRPRVPRLEAYH
jgi:tetratricopeptide (TPR) repeat protein